MTNYYKPFIDSFDCNRMEDMEEYATSVGLVHTVFESIPQFFIQVGVIIVFAGKGSVSRLSLYYHQLICRPHLGLTAKFVGLSLILKQWLFSWHLVGTVTWPGESRKKLCLLMKNIFKFNDRLVEMITFQYYKLRYHMLEQNIFW